jgi:flavin-dependent dehydrogenase
VARGEDGADFELRAPVTIDASGRDLFAARRSGWRVADENLKKVALWTYYKGAVRDPGIDEGATTVAYVPDKGWFWYIPLPNDTVSVGIVAEKDYLYRSHKGDPDAIFAREIEVNPWIRNHLAPGEKMAPCRLTGDYSYRSQYCASDGLVLAGDAFAFLDPVFSSGVFLALQSGVMAADAVHDALGAGDVSAVRFEAYGDHFRQGIEAMRRLVHAFYDTTFNFGSFLKARPDLRGDLTDCLIGNVYKDLEPLFEAVGEFARVPAPLPHGRPFGSPLLQASA